MKNWISQISKGINLTLSKKILFLLVWISGLLALNATGIFYDDANCLGMDKDNNK